jgi:MFS family permease
VGRWRLPLEAEERSNDQLPNRVIVATSAQGLPAQRERSTFAYMVLLAVGAVDAAGYSIIAPVIPAIARSTGAGPGLIGVMVASFALGSVVASVLAAVGVKRGRTTRVLMISLTMAALGSLGFVFGDGLIVYFVSRLIMGVGAGGVWMGITFNILERYPGQEYLCMSRVFAAYAVGGLVGPLLGSFGGIARPFAAYFVLVLVAGVLVAVMGESHSTRSFDTDRSALRLPAFWLASAGLLFAVLGLGMVDGVLSLHFGSQLSQTEIGVLYAATSVVVATSSALAARFRPRYALAAALGLIIVGIAVAGVTREIPAWIAALAVTGGGIGLANTGSIGVLLEGVPTERIVTAMVVWSQLGIVGYFIGPLAGGLVAQTVGYQAIGLVPLLGAIPVSIFVIRTRSMTRRGRAPGV